MHKQSNFIDMRSLSGGRWLKVRFASSSAQPAEANQAIQPSTKKNNTQPQRTPPNPINTPTTR
ncbi:hypothetical protein PGT21_018860 [Puccinia graminis f. sp. tritici]|uniref:Uncharacterized protein n=1 Tax=Puccinia graminis f. sp. tritici TaxID=56615 RepID=A0A5B0LKM1_PUCGR|nr:hypothetical protein PGT21_018860 [Puccinia graminis f. sp. tritici]KAA1122768.1 hypothetical protein PGTUg99_007342 [Puccinia graminis f. sp. tritici]